MALIDELRAKRDIILSSAARCGLKDVRVFGSAARGEENATSDVDLLVDVVHADDPLAFVDFQEEVSHLVSRRVDIVFEQGLSHLLRDKILREAKPV